MRINRNNVNLIFLKPQTLFQKFKGFFGYPVCSMGLLIGDFIYHFRSGEKYLQEIYCQPNHNIEIRMKYHIIDTGFSADKLKGDWRRELMDQKARQSDRLWLKFRYVKSLMPVLNQLPKPFHYRYCDITSSIYLKRRLFYLLKNKKAYD